MIIEGSNIQKDYGGQSVLSGADIAVANGEKVGLVGGNGSGKTTLLRILSGEDEDYKGTVRRMGGARVAFVGQYFPDFEGTAAEFLSKDVLALRSRLRALEEDMSVPDRMQAAMGAYGPLRERYDRLGGDEIEDRAARLLESIGLSGSANKLTQHMSGGERNTLALAAGILSNPELLVLDEPGNHLDIWGLSWLENYLSSIPQAVLMVSHNRYLLDRTVQRVVELEGGKTSSYPGGWSNYRMARLRSSAAQGLAYSADQKRLERLEALVKRFEQIARSRPDPAWGKRLRSRRTQLEKAKAEAVEQPSTDGPAIQASFAFDDVSKADIAVSVTDYSVVLGSRVLFDGAELFIRVGERVGLVGPNGCGKTTFLRDLALHGSWDNRRLRVGPSLRALWCAQDQEVFDPLRSIRDEFLRLGAFTEDEVFSTLKRFLFSRADLDKSIASLSGGERNRLQLARAVLLRSDFLILDEPTNHLDIGAREAIEDSLADFNGTLLVASHDRYFLDKTVDRIVEVSAGHFRDWRGNFSEFWHNAYGSSAMLPGRGKSGDQRLERRGQRVTSGKRERGASSEIPGRIERLEAERAALESASAEALDRRDYREARRLGNEIASLGRIIDELYERWMDQE